MAILDIMRHIRPDVSTVCVGLAASMGAIILGAGTKGKRYSLPSSRIMVHQRMGGGSGTISDLEIQTNEMLHHKATLNGHLAYFTGKPLEQIIKDTDRDFFMSPQEAKNYGLIDGIIMNPLKALHPLAAASSDESLPPSADASSDESLLPLAASSDDDSLLPSASPSSDEAQTPSHEHDAHRFQSSW